jgi:hypothetical protein
MVSGRSDALLLREDELDKIFCINPSALPLSAPPLPSKSILFATIKHGTGNPPKPYNMFGLVPSAYASVVGADIGAEKVPLFATSRAQASHLAPDARNDASCTMITPSIRS